MCHICLSPFIFIGERLDNDSNPLKSNTHACEITSLDSPLPKRKKNERKKKQKEEEEESLNSRLDSF